MKTTLELIGAGFGTFKPDQIVSAFQEYGYSATWIKSSNILTIKENKEAKKKIQFSCPKKGLTLADSFNSLSQLAQEITKTTPETYKERMEMHETARRQQEGQHPQNPSN